MWFETAFHRVFAGVINSFFIVYRFLFPNSLYGVIFFLFLFVDLFQALPQFLLLSRETGDEIKRVNVTWRKSRGSAPKNCNNK